MMTDNNKFSFEAGLKRLEEIVDRLSSEEVSLNESFKLYEEGTRLIRQCSGILNEFEGKIKTLTGDIESGYNLEHE